MRNCFQVTICKSWFWLENVKALVTSQVVTCLGKACPILKNSLEKSAYQRSFSHGDITCWFYNTWQNWTCRMKWKLNCNYTSLEVFIQEFYLHLSGCLNGICVPFTTNLRNLLIWCGNCIFSLFPLSMKQIEFKEHPWQLFAFWQKPDKWTNNMSTFSALDVPDWKFVVVPAVIS